MRFRPDTLTITALDVTASSIGSKCCFNSNRDPIRSTAYSSCFISPIEQNAHHRVGLGETPRRLIRKCCRYSSLEKLEDAVDTASHFMPRKYKLFRTNDKVGKLWATQQLVAALVFWYCVLPVQSNICLTDKTAFVVCPHRSVISSRQVNHLQFLSCSVESLVFR